MARIDVFKIEGFDELNRKLKQLPDRVKRKEVLAIQRRIAKPVQAAYSANLPKRSGTLSKSVAIKAVSVRRSGGNPIIEVVPGRRGRYDAYYKFMVIRKGDNPGSTARGSRKGINTVVPDARDKTLSQLSARGVADAEGKVAQYVQKKIDQLSVV